MNSRNGFGKFDALSELVRREPQSRFTKVHSFACSLQSRSLFICGKNSPNIIVMDYISAAYKGNLVSDFCVWSLFVDWGFGVLIWDFLE